MKIDWNSIKEKYPKSIKNLMRWISIKNQDGNKIIINFSQLCYCDIEKFFDEKGIMIIIDLRLGGWIYFIATLDDNNNNKNSKYERDLNSRNEAKEKAIYAAFQILEDYDEIIKMEALS